MQHYKRVESSSERGNFLKTIKYPLVLTLIAKAGTWLEHFLACPLDLVQKTLGVSSETL